MFGTMLHDLYKGSLQVLTLRVSWAIIGFIGQVIIARAVSIETYGQYSLILTWLAVLCLAGRLGFDESSVKFVARYNEKDQATRLHAFIHFALMYVTITSVVLGMITGLVILKLENNNPPLMEAWLIGLLCFPFLCLNSVRQGILRGMRQFARSQLGDTTIRPLAVIILILFMQFGLGMSIDLPILMWISTSAIVLAFFLGIYWLNTSLPDRPTRTSTKAERTDWLKTSAWMALLSSSILVLNRTDILMLGAMRDAMEVGLYTAAVRIATLFTFGLSAVNTAVAPLLSRAHGRGDLEGLSQLMRKGTLISVSVGLLLLLATLLLGDYILILFGSEYLQAKTTFFILVSAHLVSAIAGPTGTLMNMTGHHKTMAIILAVAGLINIVLNLILVPGYGTEGAAAATLMSTFAWKLYTVLYVHRNLKIRPGIMAFLPDKP
ncbi:MAG: flippase [Gammaproteobacteria bacterium]|nr:flippase [Gammaproteobacteria bacterium]